MKRCSLTLPRMLFPILNLNNMPNKRQKNLNIMLKKILKNLKRWLLPVTIIVFALFVDAGTDSNGISSDEEGTMYAAWILVIINVCLFVFHKMWQKIIDKQI